MAKRPHPLAERRRSGVLLHISSLPSGTFGEDAFRFVDFLAAGGFRLWQILPTCPTDTDGSPYNGSSAFAGNPDFIDRTAFALAPETSSDDMDQWREARRRLLALDPPEVESFRQFVGNNRYWLRDYACYVLLKRQYQRSWIDWPEPARRRDKATLEAFEDMYRDDMEAIYFQQYLFYQQWWVLKQYANDRSILIAGDMPIFVAHDSVDCWANQDLYLLEEDGRAKMVAGVPPDYFSETGQRWGNPQYNWEVMAQRNFSWWIQRFQFCFQKFDLIRVDHFRGFQACWFIPASEPLAIKGYWQKVPGAALFSRLLAELGELPIIAEDLGVITPEVERLRDQFGLPGMKILQFAFDGNADNPYLPKNHIANSVVYTGTHDNNTIRGWFDSLTDSDRQRVLAVLNGKAEEIPWLMIRQLMQSVANTVVVPMQDLLSLGSEARMNTPGTVENNWRWRFCWSQVTDDIVAEAARLNRINRRV